MMLNVNASREWIFRLSNSWYAVGRSIVQFDDDNDDDAVGEAIIANAA